MKTNYVLPTMASKLTVEVFAFFLGHPVYKYYKGKDSAKI